MQKKKNLEDYTKFDEISPQSFGTFEKQVPDLYSNRLYNL